MIGSTIAYYKILEKLGEGGMGVVYKAHDTKLDRDVALKFLPSHRQVDDIEQARFLQEAKAASSINHPNVCVIHDIQEHDGQQYIVMEYVAGVTLRQKIQQGRLPLKNVIDYSLQIAEALHEAHSKGIIHRDIKSENIMVNAKNQIKVMDFGLAKLKGAVKLTKTTSTLGTLAYMSPEQIQGSEVDGRSDIFSFGVVLYEMLTGKLPFQAEYEPALMYAIVNEEPEPVDKYRPDLSSEFLHVLNRALEKDAEDRYQSVKDVLIDLKRLKRDTQPAQQTMTIPGVKQRRSKFYALRKPALYLSGAAIILAALYLLIPPKTKVPVKISKLTTYKGQEKMPKLSPDGNLVAFSWMGDIYVNQVGGTGQIHLTDSKDEDLAPEWSPDGKQIIFVRYSENEGESGIYVTPSLGGPGSARKLTSVKIHHWWNPSWSPDGRTIIYSDLDTVHNAMALYSFDIAANKIKPFTNPPMEAYEGFTAFSPDGKELAFVRYLQGSSSIIKKSGTSQEEFTVITNFGDISGLTWTPDSREIIFCSYQNGLPKLWRISAKGGEPAWIQEAGLNADFPTVSRQGDRLAFQQEESDVTIWKAELDNIQKKAIKQYQFITKGKWANRPAISPRSKQIAFRSKQSGNADLWISDSTGQNARQVTFLNVKNVYMPQWSPQEDRLAFVVYSEGQSDIYILDIKSGKVTPLTSTPFEEDFPQWSRDGRWIYFTSNRTGGYESYRIPATGGDAVQITFKGGGYMQESWDGKSLFFFRDHGIWQIPMNGGQENFLVQAQNEGADFAVAKDGIYYVDRTRDQENDLLCSVKFYNLTTGSVSKITQNDTKSPFQLAVSPDGSWMLYAVYESEIDIWLVENWR